MDLGSIFVILGLAVFVVAFVARPFLQAGPRRPLAAPSDAQDHSLSALLAERDQVLTTLQELEFDHLLGKIPEDEYPAQRQALVTHGAEVLRRLDELQPPASPSAPAEPPPPAPAAEDSLEAMIAARRSRQGKSGGFCPKCGNALQPEDRFCSKCGASTA